MPADFCIMSADFFTMPADFFTMPVDFLMSAGSHMPVSFILPADFSFHQLIFFDLTGSFLVKRIKIEV